MGSASAGREEEKPPAATGSPFRAQHPAPLLRVSESQEPTHWLGGGGILCSHLCPANSPRPWCPRRPEFGGRGDKLAQTSRSAGHRWARRESRFSCSPDQCGVQNRHKLFTVRKGAQLGIDPAPPLARTLSDGHQRPGLAAGQGLPRRSAEDRRDKGHIEKVSRARSPQTAHRKCSSFGTSSGVNTGLCLSGVGF